MNNKKEYIKIKKPLFKYFVIGFIFALLGAICLLSQVIYLILK